MNNLIKKGIVVAVILLFIIVSVIPSTGNRVSFDDITPPVTTCTLNPPEPNGNNSWYVSDVEVTLNATDDMSGVNRTEYRINGGSIQTYTEPFNVTDEGALTVEYRSVDYAGNVEDWKSVEFKIDQTKPQIGLYWDVGNINDDLIFTADCADAISGMNYVEFYQDEELMCIDNAAPFDWHIPGAGEVKYSAVGLIFNPQFHEEDVTVFALFVRTAWSMPFFPKSSLIYAIGYDMAGNSATDDPGYPPDIWNRHIFERLTFTSNYTGHIGRFFINARFKV